MKTQDLFSTFHQQEMSSYFPGSRASVRVAVALEDKQHNNKCLALSPLPPYLSTLLLNVVSEQMSYLTEYPLVSGSAVLAVSPLKILPTPSLLARGNVGETGGMLERQPWCCGGLLSSSQNTGVIVIDTLLATNAKYSIVRDATGKLPHLSQTQ